MGIIRLIIVDENSKEVPLRDLTDTGIEMLIGEITQLNEDIDELRELK